MGKKCECPNCEKRQEEDVQQDEFNMAVLIALVPLMVFTFFGQLGLF